MTTPKLTPKQVWERIEQQTREDEMARFRAKSPTEVDASLRAAGFDPAAVRAEGTALAKKLQADRDRLSWQVEAAEGLAREQARVDARAPKYAALSRADLLARIEVARHSPRFAQPAAVMFRNRKTEEASDDELRALLEELEDLAARED